MSKYHEFIDKNKDFLTDYILIQSITGDVQLYFSTESPLNLYYDCFIYDNEKLLLPIGVDKSDIELLRSELNES